VLLLDVTFNKRRDLALVYSDFKRMRGEGRPGQFSVAYGESLLVFPSLYVVIQWSVSLNVLI
jgi:hypothetical protein